MVTAFLGGAWFSSSLIYLFFPNEEETPTYTTVPAGITNFHVGQACVRPNDQIFQLLLVLKALKGLLSAVCSVEVLFAQQHCGSRAAAVSSPRSALFLHSKWMEHRGMFNWSWETWNWIALWKEIVAIFYTKWSLGLIVIVSLLLSKEFNYFFPHFSSAAPLWRAFSAPKPVAVSLFHMHPAQLHP